MKERCLYSHYSRERSDLIYSSASIKPSDIIMAFLTNAVLNVGASSVVLSLKPRAVFVPLHLTERGLLDPDGDKPHPCMGCPINLK